jgi:hypothetical protein
MFAEALGGKSKKPSPKRTKTTSTSINYSREKMN